MKTKRSLSLMFLLGILLLNLGLTAFAQKSKKVKNEVLVLGTIHSGHLTDSVYNVEYLTKLIKQIKPDIILTEIPPDRFDEAMREFK